MLKSWVWHWMLDILILYGYCYIHTCFQALTLTTLSDGVSAQKSATPILLTNGPLLLAEYESFCDNYYIDSPQDGQQSPPLNPVPHGLEDSWEYKQLYHWEDLNI